YRRYIHRNGRSLIARTSPPGLNIVAVAASGRDAESRRAGKRGRHGENETGLQELRWAIEQITGIVGKVLTAIVIRCGAANHRNLLAGCDNDFFPASTAGEIRILIVELTGS